MGFSEFYVIGADFKDFDRGDLKDRQLMADIVIVDKTHGEGHNPFLYQLKKRTVEDMESGGKFYEDFLYQEDHPFVFIGEVTSIDRKNKLIHLAGGYVLSYKYLIVAWGVCNHHGHEPKVGGEEFSPALHALFEALKIRRQGVIPYVVSKNSSGEVAKVSYNDCCNVHQDIEELVRSTMKRWDNKPPAAYMVCEEKRCFEVQV